MEKGKGEPAPPEAPKKGDELKKKFEAEPPEDEQKRLKQVKKEAGPDFKIEVDAFDDGDVADHIKSDEKKIKKEKEDKEAKKNEPAPTAPEPRKADDPIKSAKDYNEEIIQHIRDSDSSLRIEVSKLNDEEIDEQIEEHKESLKIAELRRKNAEIAAKRIQEEDEAEAKKKEAALVEKEKKNRINQDWTISTDKLEDLETGESKAQKETKVQVEKKKVEAKPESKNTSAPAPKVEKKEVNNTKTAVKLVE